MDNWCATIKKCGDDDEGETCDCTCGGKDTKPEPEPEAEPEVGHTISPAEKANKVFKGLKGFCEQNKAYYCDTRNTVDMAPDLCDCTPTSTPEPEAEPESEPEAEPESEPEAEPESKPQAGAEGDSPPDSLSFNQCKKKCQTMCVKRSGGVATNQGWGKPRYIHCKCSDGFEQKFAGCECRNGRCPDSMKVSLASTKFAGQIRRKVDAHGELSLD
jgi:hypothetical protein